MFFIEKGLIYIFIAVYLIALAVFIYLTYEYFACDKEDLIAPIAIILSAILASTAMARAYIQNDRHIKQTTRRELFDRRIDIIMQFNNIFQCYIDKEYEEAISKIEEITKIFIRIPLVYEPKEVELFRPLMKDFHRIITLTKQKKILLSRNSLSKKDSENIDNEIGYKLKNSQNYYYEKVEKNLHINRV